MPKSIRCLVTGGAGFIGSHLVARLIAEGYTVRVLDNLSTGRVENLPASGGVELMIGNVQDTSAGQAAVREVDVVFHLAAIGSVPASIADPQGTHDANVTGTISILEAARGAGVRRVVFSSSCAVYGDVEGLPKRESDELVCLSPYAASKLAGEQYVTSYARSGLLEGVALRYFNIFGPRQPVGGPYAAVIPVFMKAAREGRPAPVFGDGRQTRDFTFVNDVVEANLLAARLPAERVSGAVVNIGRGEATSLLDLVAMIGAAAGRKLEVAHLEARPGEVMHSAASLERAGRLLGYQPSVSILDGLKAIWRG